MSLVVFAVLRIVTALFIKETLSTAAQDAELVIEDSRRCALQYQRKLEENGQFMVPKATKSHHLSEMGRRASEAPVAGAV